MLQLFEILYTPELMSKFNRTGKPYQGEKRGRFKNLKINRVLISKTTVLLIDIFTKSYLYYSHIKVC